MVDVIAQKIIAIAVVTTLLYVSVAAERLLSPKQALAARTGDES